MSLPFGFHPPGQGLNVPPLWMITGGKVCAMCAKKMDVRLACGHSFCHKCFSNVNDEFDTDVRCTLCVYKAMAERDAVWGPGTDYHMTNVNLTKQLQGLWLKQKDKTACVLNGQPIICTACKKRAAQVYKNQLDPEAAVEIKDHTCLYESKIPSLEEIEKSKKAPVLKKSRKKHL